VLRQFRVPAERFEILLRDVERLLKSRLFDISSCSCDAVENWLLSTDFIVHLLLDLFPRAHASFSTAWPFWRP
jgi:hypothetical protein